MTETNTKYSISRLSYLFFLSFIALLLGTNITYAQNYPQKEIDVDNFIQDIFSLQDDDVNYEDLYESLFQLYTNPINLNKANREDLASLYILSPLQINNFLEYVRRNGSLLTIYELQAIPNFDLETIRRLMPFVTIEDAGLNADSRSLWTRIKEEKNNYLFVRADQFVEQKKGYSTLDTTSSSSSRYLGSPQHFYARYRISHVKDFSMGFTLEKDAGEQFIWDPTTKRYGVDFYSFHFQVENKGKLKSLVIGDYQIQTGQSLLLAAGFNVGKGAETVSTIRRSNLGIRPFTSALEVGFFRGAAATYRLGQFDVTGFYSNTNRDASIQSQNVPDSLDLGQQEGDFASYLSLTGFHRTKNEVASKHQINQQVMGSNVKFSSKDNKLQVGATFLNTTFSLPVIRDDSKPYNKFQFKGTQNYNFGLNYTYSYQNFNFFGEMANSKSGGKAIISGVVASLTSMIDVAMLYRNFGKNFHSFFGSPLNETGRNKSINEQGMYWGIKISPNRRWNMAAYYDKFKFPWLKSQVDAPSEGYEYLGRVTYKPTREITLYAQMREEVKEKNQINNVTNLDYLTPYYRRNYIFNIDYKTLKFLTLKTRIQAGTYNQENFYSAGYVILQDVNIDYKRISVSMRFSLFDTDDYNTRQYVYEKDVLYAFSIPAFYGEGIRNYILVQYAVTPKIDVWARYARTTSLDNQGFSAGLEEISGNNKSNVKFQVRVKF